MSNTVIKIENLSKQYRLGVWGSSTLRDEFARGWARLRGKADPTLTIGQTNELAKTSGSSTSVSGLRASDSDNYVWALKDINFEVKQGEVLGIIGKNGAGKSTLLKILSRVTSPTTGSIKCKGRIASLLEVGTGMHPEMTGRENIFLNGAILGMTKWEIKNKFDEIVDFAGIAKYVDTPIKRYSSGMRVRLGFAIAAFLDPEILIVDEVLAVGDAEFQKKAIGKMQDVSQGEGRTVLFVSHNMNSINTLCSNCIFLANGTIKNVGNPNEIITKYLSDGNTLKNIKIWNGTKPGDNIAKLHEARIVNSKGELIEFCQLDETFGIEYSYEVSDANYIPLPNVHFFTINDEYVFVSSPDQKQLIKKTGLIKSTMWIPPHLLNQGTYKIGIALTSLKKGTKVHFYERNILTISLFEDFNKRNIDHVQKMPGIIKPKLNWNIEKIEI